MAKVELANSEPSYVTLQEKENEASLKKLTESRSKGGMKE
jgi:hypothetical protein